MQASHLHDDTLGRALDPLYDFGVTALYGLIAVTAATRLGLARTFSHLDTTSFGYPRKAGQWGVGQVR
jgi:hypothetical protein